MAVSLTEYLQEIQELTKKNFEILKALNDSFYTKSEHLSVNIDNTNYVIPSFLSIENKLNSLQDNFENLVNSPRTGEAVFDFNGNTQSIEVKGFTNVPGTAFENADIDAMAVNMKNFESKKNEIFKDFLTPVPYVKIDLSTIPDDIQQVNVKKIIVKNLELLSLLKTASNWQTADQDSGTAESVCVAISYSDVVKKLYSFTADEDYVEYDKVYTMPIRYELGSGKYKIKKINKNWTDDNFLEHYNLQLDKLTYKIADETIERSLYEGDYLITNNDKVKLLIEKIYSSTNTVQVRVENGGFADLCTEDDGNVDLSTLKFFAIGNIQKMKYLQIPLEEDRYVLIFLAPIQRNSLIQSAWSSGLMFDIYALTNSDGTTFEEYYNTQVTNIGDKLFGLVSMAGQDFVNIGESEFNSLVNSKPVIDTDALKVTLINKHMSNSETVAEIYNLYNQKEDYKTELNTIQKQIDEINSILSTISFEDTTTNRTIYTDQLSALNEKKQELTTNIANCIQQITIASTDTDTPVENPKYHIRGFFDYEKFLVDNELDGHEIIKIDVQYRYKNANRTTGNAETIGENNVYSDWNVMQSFINERVPNYNNGNYTYELPENTSYMNVPSFNQLDIPISQGETVDVKLRVVYFVGYPFVKTTSEWSDIVNIEFPVELRKNITVIDILEQNNSDATKELFRSYLEKQGVISHVSDNLVDQNITYYHQPEHIASGFYTDERRVIPLKDKLQTLTDNITKIQDEVFGTFSENIVVSLSDGESEIIVNPLADNTYILKDFSSASKTKDESGKNHDKVETTLTLKIKNNSTTHNLKLYSMYPGNSNDVVTNKGTHRFNTKDISRYGKNAPCVCLYVDSSEIEDSNTQSKLIPQVHNQWIYFRVTDPFNGTEYYNHANEDSDDIEKNLYMQDYIIGYSNYYQINRKSANIIKPTFISKDYLGGMIVYPYLTDIKDICINNNDESNYYKTIKPGESLQVNINVMYSLAKNANSVEKTICFDIRNSLYTDPVNYKIKLVAKYSNSLANNVRKINKSRYTPVVIN